MARWALGCQGSATQLRPGMSKGGNYGKSVWDGKPAAIFSNSPGSISGFGANHHLRQSLVFLNMPAMQQPEVYIAKVNELFEDNGNIKEGNSKDFLQKAVSAYIDWFRRNARAGCPHWCNL